MSEHGRPVMLEVLVEQDTGRRLGQERGESRLARYEGLAPQVVAIQFDQIDGAQEHAVVVVAVSQSVEIRDAIVAASDRLAVDDDRART